MVADDEHRIVDGIHGRWHTAADGKSSRRQYGVTSIAHLMPVATRLQSHHSAASTCIS